MSPVSPLTIHGHHHLLYMMYHHDDRLVFSPLLLIHYLFVTMLAYILLIQKTVKLKKFDLPQRSHYCQGEGFLSTQLYLNSFFYYFLQLSRYIFQLSGVLISIVYIST
jgi:hypothetical protein